MTLGPILFQSSACWSRAVDFPANIGPVMTRSFPVGVAADIGEVEEVPKGGQQIGVADPAEVVGKLRLVEGAAGGVDGGRDEEGRELWPMVRPPAVKGEEAIGGGGVKLSCLGKVSWSGARLGDGVTPCSREVGGLMGVGNWKEAGWKVVGWNSAPPQE